MKIFQVLTFICTALAMQVNAETKKDMKTNNATYEIVSASEVSWEKLNPARGDKSPQAGTLWGDRNGEVPTGFLVKFVDGFSSPPHIHNVTYRAVVISGLIHNDDPDAASMWMPASSFWTQPKGEVHITAAKGTKNVVLVEIDKGPYLVRPTDDAFDSGERPINVDVSNLVWVNMPGKQDTSIMPEIAYLWGTPGQDRSYGSFIKLPAGFSGQIRTNDSTLRAVIVQGMAEYNVPGNAVTILEPGSYFGSKGIATHKVSSTTGEDIIVYVHTDGKYDISSVLP
jgi:hypothetical protein